MTAIAQLGPSSTPSAPRPRHAEIPRAQRTIDALRDVGIGDLLIFFSLILLFFELLKSTSSQKIAIVNHALSMILFVLCLIAFLLLRGFATSTFFLITTMVMLDVLAGFIVTIISARKDFDIGAAGH